MTEVERKREEKEILSNEAFNKLEGEEKGKTLSAIMERKGKEQIRNPQ